MTLVCRRKWQPTPVLLPGKSHGQRSLVGYGPWSQRVGHDWAASLHYIIGAAHSEESRGLYFSLDPANTTGNYRRSINPYNCQISLLKGDRNFLDRMPHKMVVNLRQEPGLWMKSKTHYEPEQRKGASYFPQIFHIKHHVVSMYLVSFDSNHNSGPQIVHILRINLIIICCMCFLQYL